jgi:geranylgeranyl reductase family protein
MTLRADVVVVGAGPAGSTAALRLATAGRDVMLLDRVRFPRSKVCGDGLTPRAIAALGRLGVWPAIAPDARLVTELRTIDLLTGMARVGPVPSRVEGAPEVGAVVSRTVLDDALRRAAIAAGTRFVATGTVRLLEPGRPGRPARLSVAVDGRPCELEADVVVAADGASSRIAEAAFGSKPGVVRGIGIRQYWRLEASAAFTICVPLLDGAAELAGYGWVFPTALDGANVGVGVVGKSPYPVREIYRRFIDRLSELWGAWRFAMPSSNLEGGALAAGLPPDRVARGGLLFVGDAAGAINPFSGEGIAQAIDSACAAADAVLAVPHRDRRLGDAYWARLMEAFPHTTRHADSLPWLVDRGKTFTREFWHAVSDGARLISRGARRMSLEDGGSTGVAASAEASATWAALRRRLCVRRPLLMELLDGMRDEVMPLIEPILDRVRAWRGAGQGAREQLSLALTLLALVLVVSGDVGHERPAGEQAGVDAVQSWATNSAALGVADILVAELFDALARLPTRWAVTLAEAASAAVARETRALASRAAGGDVARRVSARVARSTSLRTLIA